MKKRLLYTTAMTLFLLLILTCVSAQDYLPHKLNTGLNLVVSSNNATACNISSIQYSDGSVKLTSYEMAKSYQDFNYSIASGNFSSLGDICFGVTCTDGVNIEVGSICRTVTPNGVVQSTAQGTASLGFLILMLALTGLFGWMGFKFSESDKLWVFFIFFLHFSHIIVNYQTLFPFHLVLCFIIRCLRCMVGL